MTAARRRDPITSHEAARDAGKVEQASQAAVLQLMRMIGHAVTAEDLEDFAQLAALPYSRSRVRSALPELESMNKTRRAGFFRPPNARRRTLWEVV